MTTTPRTEPSGKTIEERPDERRPPVDLTRMHQHLSAAHSEALAHAATHLEGLDGASCGPHLKHLAQLAAAMAAEGASAAEWRSALLAQAGPTSRDAVDAAEACMRQSGLWPWHPE